LLSLGPDWDREMAAIFGETTESRSQAQIRYDTQIVEACLTDPARAHDPGALAECIAAAERARSAAGQLNLVDDQNTMSWAISVCQRRLGDHGAAADTLTRLWHDLEAQRNGVLDPLKRSGTFSRFPHLFPVLAGEMLQTGRGAQMVEVLEAGKGRLLADTVVARTAAGVVTGSSGHSRPGSSGPGAPGAASALSGAAESSAWRSYEVPALPEGTHLLTYLVDDDCVYAALAAADGSRHSVSIPLSRTDLRRYASTVDPSTWGKRSRGFGKPPNPDDLPEFLAPLVSWLQPLIQKGVLREGDHLCYSPDEELYLIPLHLLMLDQRPLVDSFSVSRTHALLVAEEEGTNSSGPARRACVVVVMARDDDPAKAASFARVADTLEGMVPCERVMGTDATVDSIVGRDLSDQIVHFTTHGRFPQSGSGEGSSNPFRRAGLVLAAKAGLPSLTSVEHEGGLLSPERVVELRLTGSHVTTQACSTGLAREGSGGDALGVELGFLLSGASSLLTTHWDVPVDPAGEFCSLFYRAWLVDGATRAAAWRSAVLEMKDMGRPPHQWAAFSLTGAWR
jgi:CHAT domain-containing protein